MRVACFFNGLQSGLMRKCKVLVDWFGIDQSTRESKGAEQPIRDVVVSNSSCKSDWFLDRQPEQE